MKKICILGLIAALATTRSASAQLIEGDNFIQSPPTVLYSNGAMNIAVEYPQSPGDEWSSVNTGDGNDVFGNGVANVGGDSGGFAKLSAPFDPSTVTGSYTLSFTVSFNPGTASGFFFYGGLGDAPNADGYQDNTGSLMFDSSGDTTGTSFTLDAGTGPFSSDLSSTISRASTSDSYSMDLAITVDPTTNLDTFYVDGSSIGTVTYTGVIGQVWFKDQGNDPSTDSSNGINISKFAITGAVPEPSSWAMILSGLVALSLLARRAGFPFKADRSSDSL